MNNMTPILTPLKKLFSSRKFLLALAVIVTALLTRAIPSLLPYAEVITNIVLFVFGALFLQLGVEDILVLRPSLPKSVDQAKRDIGTEITNVVTPDPAAVQALIKAEFDKYIAANARG